MKKIKIQCPVCSITLKFEQIPNFCVNCNMDWHNQNEELRAIFSNCSFLPEGRRPLSGSLRITNKRLLFIKEDSGGVIVGLGVIGWLFASLIAHGLNKRAEKNKKTGFSIPLEDITSMEKADEKKNKGLIIATRDRAEYKVKAAFKREYDTIREAIAWEAGNRANVVL
ncbi:MAG: hypothetical protein FWG44_01690 [Oscillospiraceae bacterium]|nr:hypothetical protein [Oscillospiraceae bacterium]